MSREEAAQEELREGERGYDAAEARKGALLQQETAAWEALGELCRKCSVARRELTRRLVNPNPNPNPNPKPNPNPNPKPNPNPNQASWSPRAA